MSLRDYLRLRSNRRQALTQLCACYPGSEIAKLDPAIRYLHLQLGDEQGRSVLAWFNVDDWLEKMGIHLPEIPWFEVPLSYLIRWLKSFQISFLVNQTDWQVTQIAECIQPLPEEVLMLPADPCPLFCIDWPQGHTGVQFGPMITVWHIPFRLQVILGYSQIKLSQLTDLAPGDLLLITQMFTHLAIGQCRLYEVSYGLNQEIIVGNELTKDHEVYQEGETLNDWGCLPVNIEFVLDSRTVTLSELDEIKAGTSLILSHDAEKKIAIYLNKRLFASGELVVLENGPLAVEINRVNPGLIEEAE
ncbi:type III secretion protein Q [Izhakiella capsodis]|uniref:Type III secretion protein Q n=1 Tax=Izhakiella capsodis TaxID=1367852 RepID=A0A1I5AW05_9GAMM|nr:FliM/FliN family flagellar motor switch protein [Izhakiella capsodis]SFN66570.1 type III secretion protein Q [Izhakiella capsodis]